MSRMPTTPRSAPKWLSAFGFATNTHGVGDLAAVVNGSSDAEVEKTAAEYDDRYTVGFWCESWVWRILGGKLARTEPGQAC